MTALHHAAAQGRDEVAKVLLENGASYSLVDRYDTTPLHYAAVRGHEKVVALLLELISITR